MAFKYLQNDIVMNRMEMDVFLEEKLIYIH